ncbi:MAG: hypothetical protein U0R66_04935 [Mycobacterium sp.]
MHTILTKVALGTVAAVGLYLPSIVAVLPDSCVNGIGIAGAAPSPSCGGDLRECLRKSADMRQTTFGGRFVTAEDVARCTEGFDACIHGGAARGGSPSPPGSRPPQGGTTTSTSTSASSGGQGGAGGGGQRSSGSSDSRDMPPYRPFTLVDSMAYDCAVSGESVTCAITRRDQLPETMDSWKAEFTGTLSGSTMTGTQITRTQSHYTAVQCIENSEGTEKVSYTFNGDGTVKIRSDGIQWHTSNCSESHDNTTPANEVTVPWS